MTKDIPLALGETGVRPDDTFIADCAPAIKARPHPQGINRHLKTEFGTMAGPKRKRFKSKAQPGKDTKAGNTKAEKDTKTSKHSNMEKLISILSDVVRNRP